MCAITHCESRRKEANIKNRMKDIVNNAFPNCTSRNKEKIMNLNKGVQIRRRYNRISAAYFSL